MSSNIGPNFNNKINGRPNPFSNGAKTSTYTRALGSTSIFAAGPGGWRGAARGANPYDTQSMNVARYARMRAGVNVYAGRNIGSFGALAHQSGANDMSGLEKAMMYTQLGMMAASVVNEIAGMFGSGKSEKAAPATVADPAAVNPTKGNGKAGKTSADAKRDVETKKGTLDTIKSNLSSVDLAGIAGCKTENLESIKTKYGIDIDLVNLKSLQDIDLSSKDPIEQTDIDLVKSNAELVNTSLKSATTGIGKLTENATMTRAQLAQLQNVPVKQRDATYEAKVQELQSELQKIESAKVELEALKGKLESANTSLSKLANELPNVVKEYNEAVENQKEVEKKEVADLKELAADVDSTIGKMADGKKIEKNSNKLGQLASQITALKTLVEAHSTELPERETAVKAAKAALSRISQMNIKVGGGEVETPTEIDGNAISESQLAEMNKQYGVNLEFGKETVIAGKKFKVTADGQFLVDDKSVKSGQEFVESIKQANAQIMTADDLKNANKELLFQLEFDKEIDINGKKYKVTADGQYFGPDGTVTKEQFFTMIKQANSEVILNSMINTVPILQQLGSGNEVSVVGSDNKAHKIQMKDHHSNKPTYIIDGKQVEKNEFDKFVATAKLKA